jgi:hypothetical protein
MQRTVAAHGNPRHILRAARNDDISQAAGDFAYCRVNRGLGRSTFAIDCHARDMLWPSGAEQRRPRNIPALFPNLGNAAEHNIVDMIRRKAIPINDRTQDIRPQMIGAHAGERSPKTADRGPNGINYHYSRHIASP